MDARTDADGVEPLTYRSRSREVVQRVASHLIPGREISWHLFRGDGREISSTYSVRVGPVRATSRLHLAVLTERRSVRGWLLRPVTARLASSQLRFRAQDIARASTRSA